ncbi:MAG: RelA/SpoT family protein [Cytophagales bacterium]|nr:RelA/SpoT family protein [Cytophagales bacterium]
MRSTKVEDKRKTEEEKKEVLKKYRGLLRLAKPTMKEGDIEKIRKAFKIALEAHKGMRRRSGEPYIYHPLEVACIAVKEIGLETTSIICSLLHDVVEDTALTLDEIDKTFGPKVAKIVGGLTKLANVFKLGRSNQAENFKKMVLTLSDDIRVILIKLADRLHNMRTLDSLPRDKQLKIASETEYVYTPLAHRLGLNAIKSELEDLYLKFTNTKAYTEITNKIKATKPVRERFIKRFTSPIVNKLKEQGFKFTIKGRTKSVFSIWSKMQNQNISFEEVYDLFAIRIILDTPLQKEKSACWQTYSIVTDFYKPNPDRLRDWLSNPKSNGYESLHTTVMSKNGQWVEVQIRTKRMDEIAEKGYAAHWKYKENGMGEQESGLDEWVSRVRGLLEQSNTSAIEFMDNFRSHLYNEEVFVFTPNGDLKTLPLGATILDFAFEVHSEVGIKCAGGKVNQKIVPLNYVLKNGDQVEIITSPGQKPREDWLNFAITSKALSKIKEGLKENRREIVMEGKKILRRRLKQVKLVLDDKTAEQLRAFFDKKTVRDLYYAIGKGMIAPKEIRRFKAARENIQQRSKDKIKDSKTFAKAVAEVKKTKRDQLLIGEDMDVIDYTFAKCCNPIPGDDVFGFVTLNEGVKIHRTNCPYAVELLARYGHRVLKAQWSQQKKLFIMSLAIETTYRLGLVNDVMKVISNEHRVEIQSVSFNTVHNEPGIFRGKVRILLNNTPGFDELKKKIKKVKGVISVRRLTTVAKLG